MSVKRKGSKPGQRGKWNYHEAVTEPQLNLSGTSTLPWSFRASLTKEGGGFTLASSETEMTFNKAAL